MSKQDSGHKPSSHWALWLRIWGLVRYWLVGADVEDGGTVERACVGAGCAAEQACAGVGRTAERACAGRGVCTVGWWSGSVSGATGCSGWWTSVNQPSNWAKPIMCTSVEGRTPAPRSESVPPHLTELISSTRSDRADEAPIKMINPASARSHVTPLFYDIVSHFATINSAIYLLIYIYTHTRRD
jgi:hypothetical protein